METLRLSSISRRGMLGSVQSFHFKLPKGRGGLAAPFLAIRSRFGRVMSRIGFICLHSCFGGSDSN